MVTASIVIPSFNGALDLPVLLGSIVTSGTHELVDKILVVDDKSTDSTVAVVRSFTESHELGGKLEILELPVNQGRFFARFRGAMATDSRRILFLDSRIELAPDFSKGFKEVVADTTKSHYSLIEIDISKSLYHLYWQRTHEVFFKSFYEDGPAGKILITSENFDEHGKGTGALLVDRDLFLKTCRKFEGNGLASDDTLLLKDMVNIIPLFLNPKLKVFWEPRAKLGPFLYRLWERGEGFAEYHIFEKRGLFFWLFLFGLLGLGLLAGLSVYSPIKALILMFCFLSLFAGSTIIFAKGVVEFLRMSPLNTAVILTYGIGALVGVFKVLFRKKASP